MPSHIKITHQGKAPGRFLTSQLLKSAEGNKEEMGQIFTLVEIVGPDPQFPQIGLTILNTLKREYYRTTSTSDPQNLESALKKVNEVLASIAQNGETNWIGNLNVVFCLLIGREAHIATTGQVKIWLARDNTLTPLANPSPIASHLHPLKTFSTITSGQLTKGDKVIIASSEIMTNFSPQNLKEFFANNIRDGASDLTQSLRKLRQLNVNVWAIDLEEGIYETFYLDAPSETPLTQAVSYTKKYFIPLAKKFSSGAQGYFRSGVKTARTSILPKSQEFLRHASDKSKTFGAEVAPKFQKTADYAKKFLSQRMKKPVNHEDETAMKNANIIGRSIYTINDYRKMHPQGLKKFIYLSTTYVRKTIYFLDNQLGYLKNWFLKKRKQPIATIAGILFLIVILIVSISIQKNRQSARRVEAEQRNQLTEATKKLEDGKSALIFNDKENATILMDDAIKTATSLLETNIKTDAQAIIDSASIEVDKLTQSTRIKEIKPFATNSTSKVFFTYKGNCYTFSPNGAIEKISILDGVAQNASQMPNDVGAVISLAKKSDDQLYLLTDKSKVFLFQIQTNALSEMKNADGDFKPSVDISVFGNNLYLLSAQNKQIWKYQPTDATNFGSPSPFAQSSLASALADSKAMAIDGAIYVLTKDKVAKIIKGTKTDFSLKGLPKAFADLQSAKNIYTSENTPSIFLLDATRPRVVEFDKEGKYLHQYLFPSAIKNPSWFQIDYIGRKVWALSDGFVWELDL